MLEFIVPIHHPHELGKRSLRSAEKDPWDEITRRIKSGDQDAFEIYYEHAFMIMYRQIQKLIGSDEQTTLDILQTAMFKVIRCIKPLPDESAVNAWSSAVAKSVAYDWLRNNARKLEFVSDFEHDIAEPPLEPKLIVQSRLQWIEDQLLELPHDLRKIILLRYRLGWSLRRIAETLGLKTGAIDGRIRRTIEKLQEKAQREFYER
jgi:RNA polymerase sigma factor (sigma-70 family)